MRASTESAESTGVGDNISDIVISWVVRPPSCSVACHALTAAGTDQPASPNATSHSRSRTPQTTLDGNPGPISRIRRIKSGVWGTGVSVTIR